VEIESRLFPVVAPPAQPPATFSQPCGLPPPIPAASCRTPRRAFARWQSLSRDNGRVRKDLTTIFTNAVARCAPDVVMRRFLSADTTIPNVPVTVIALGKCAGVWFDGVVAERKIARAFIGLPDGYPLPRATGRRMEIAVGAHPEMTARSFDAGRRLLEFMARDFRDSHVLFLISGGSSACVEAPLAPFTDDDLAHVNRLLVASDKTISCINKVRRHLSAIKGGRLAAMATAPATTLIYSDVAAHRLADVGSGPTLPNDSTVEEAAEILKDLDDEAARCWRIADILRRSERKGRILPSDVSPAPANDAMLLADNGTLVEAAVTVARERGWQTHTLPDQLESHVEDVAATLCRELAALPPGTLLVAGGEPTVEHRGAGRGGRCSELAIRFARQAADAGLDDVHGLFAGSDGVDGNSGAGGFVVSPGRLAGSGVSREELERALEASDSAAIAAKIGSAIMIPPTGNNLRDLFLLARG
jgi:glycerate 2-kinase